MEQPSQLGETHFCAHRLIHNVRTSILRDTWRGTRPSLLHRHRQLFPLKMIRFRHRARLLCDRDRLWISFGFVSSLLQDRIALRARIFQRSLVVSEPLCSIKSIRAVGSSNGSAINLRRSFLRQKYSLCELAIDRHVPGWFSYVGCSNNRG